MGEIRSFYIAGGNNLVASYVWSTHFMPLMFFYTPW